MKWLLQEMYSFHHGHQITDQASTNLIIVPNVENGIDHAFYNQFWVNETALCWYIWCLKLAIKGSSYTLKLCSQLPIANNFYELMNQDTGSVPVLRIQRVPWCSTRTSTWPDSRVFDETELHSIGQPTGAVKPSSNPEELANLYLRYALPSDI